jgi:hypothetical protein
MRWHKTGCFLLASKPFIEAISGWPQPDSAVDVYDDDFIRSNTEMSWLIARVEQYDIE